MIDEKTIERLRAEGGARPIRSACAMLFVATAAAAAAAASDFVSGAQASALGNVGLLLIMLRVYWNVPRSVAASRSGNKRWLQAELDYLQERYPWADAVGKAGWVILVGAVALQLFFGMR
jgi:hypothetical protein